MLSKELYILHLTDQQTIPLVYFILKVFKTLFATYPRLTFKK